MNKKHNTNILTTNKLEDMIIVSNYGAYNDIRYYDYYQLDKKEMYIIRISENDYIVYSYCTIVGYIHKHDFIMTGYGRYSQTTSKQLTILKHRLQALKYNIKTLNIEEIIKYNNEEIINAIILSYEYNY